MNINDLTFDPQCPPEALEAAKKWLVDNQDKFTKMCNFVKVKGIEPTGCLGQNCHASMAVGRGMDCIATEIGVTRQCKDWPDLVNEDLYRPYVKWLTQDSFFSRFILNRDDFDFCFRYGIVISSDVNSAVVQSILMASRYVMECNPAAFVLFNELIEKGYPGAAAYSVAMGSCISYWDYGQRYDSKTNPHTPPPTITDASDVYGHNHHRAHPYWGSTRAFGDFVRGEFGHSLSDKEDYHYRQHPTIYGTMKFCSNEGDNFVNDLLKDEEFRQALRTSRGQAKEAVKVVNPFARKTFGQVSRTPDIVTRKEMVDIVFPELIKKEVIRVVA